MNIYKELGMREVVNANGKMTILGASAVSETIADNIKAALQNFVIIDELIDYCGTVIGEMTGAEDGCPVCGAASGTAIAAAAVIAGSNMYRIGKLPNSSGMPNEIIIQKGQVVNFGGDIAQMLRIAGGVPIEVGCSNKVDRELIEGAINEKTGALFYVKSHHAVQKGMQSIETMIEIGKKYKIPVIIDAAAEGDLRKYIALGADLVIYSGGKALSGPTSGFICGKKELIQACKMQYTGIGRAMKVSKEAMIGLVTALKEYDHKQSNWESEKKKMEHLSHRLNQIDGVHCIVTKDEAGRDIYRAEFKIDEEKTGISAFKLNEKLKSGNPAIFLREYYVNQGILSIDPRPLFEGQEDVIVDEILKILGGR